MTGKVSGHGRVGGLVGEAYQTGSVGNSYGNAHIEGKHAGVLLGHCRQCSGRAIYNSHAKGSVHGNNSSGFVGGLVGGWDSIL